MFPRWLWAWWPWCASRKLITWQVLMYTRQGCHLCDDAWELLCKAQERHGFALSKIDVDTDPALAGAYGLEVPVVVVNGRVRFRGRLNEVLLRRLFRAGEARGE